MAKRRAESKRGIQNRAARRPILAENPSDRGAVILDSRLDRRRAAPGWAIGTLWRGGICPGARVVMPTASWSRR